MQWDQVKHVYKFFSKYQTELLFLYCISDQKPDVMYADIGGMDIQKQEVREAVELPLTHFELYKQVRPFYCY